MKLFKLAYPIITNMKNENETLKKSQPYSMEFFRSSKYYELKTHAVKIFETSDIWLSKNVLRERLKIHAQVVDKIIEDLVKSGFLDYVDTSFGRVYKKRISDSFVL